MPRQVSGGESLGNLSAAEFNRHAAAADFVEQLRRRLTADKNTVPRGPGQVLVKNSSGADVARFGVLAVSGSVFDPSTELAGFQDEPIFTGTTPATGSHEGKFVVLLDAIPDGQIGLAVIDGLAVVQVDVSEDSSWLVADIKDASTTELAQRAAGAAQILYKEAGSGTVWALVRLGNQTCAPEVTVKLAGELSAGNTASATVYIGSLPSRTATTLSMTVEHPAEGGDEPSHSYPSGTWGKAGFRHDVAGGVWVFSSDRYEADADTVPDASTGCEEQADLSSAASVIDWTDLRALHSAGQVLYDLGSDVIAIAFDAMPINTVLAQTAAADFPRFTGSPVLQRSLQIGHDAGAGFLAIHSGSGRFALLGPAWGDHQPAWRIEGPPPAGLHCFPMVTDVAGECVLLGWSERGTGGTFFAPDTTSIATSVRVYDYNSYGYVDGWLLDADPADVFKQQASTDGILTTVNDQTDASSAAGSVTCDTTPDEPFDPCVVAADSFDRADSDSLGSTDGLRGMGGDGLAWTEFAWPGFAGDVDISGGKAVNAAAVSKLSAARCDPGEQNVRLRADCQVQDGAGEEIMLYTRFSDDQDRYSARIQRVSATNWHLRIRRAQGGSLTDIASTSLGDIGTGEVGTLEFSDIDDALTARFYDPGGALVGTATATATHNSGQTGIGFAFWRAGNGSGNTAIDDFVAREM